MNDKPVKQAEAAAYLGLTKDNVRALIAHHGVVRYGIGEGKVLASECFIAVVEALLAGEQTTCPTCGDVHKAVTRGE